MSDKKKILLFDIDGTLTEPRKSAPPEVLEVLKEAKKKYGVGVVGGSDMVKQREQLGENCTELFHFNFAENGLIGFKDGKQFHVQSWIKKVGEKNNTRIINFVLKLFTEVDYPIKRGTFVEYRNGMLNVSPIGRQCSQQEREDFFEYDKQHGIRTEIVRRLQEEFGAGLVNDEAGPDQAEKIFLQFSIGGQISLDIFPVAWDKTYCLQFVEKEYDEIHFFGDMTHKGGNDYEIFEDPRTIGHTVKSYHDTVRILKEEFLKE